MYWANWVSGLTGRTGSAFPVNLPNANTPWRNHCRTVSEIAGLLLFVSPFRFLVDALGLGEELVIAARKGS
jgi:hypothetical protein